MGRWLAVSIVLTLAAFAASWYVGSFRYDDLPERVPTHWNLHGEADAWTPKADLLPALLILPAVMAALVVLTPLLPWLSPRHFEIDGFRSTYGYIMAATVGLLAYLHLVLLRAYLHPGTAIGRALPAGIFVFLAFVGPALRHVRRNFWMGVRTPWTLASERVWDDTHRLAARLMLWGGLAGAIAAVVGAPLVPLIVVLLVGVALLPVVYSLVRYKSLERAGEL